MHASSEREYSLRCPHQEETTVWKRYYSSRHAGLMFCIFSYKASQIFVSFSRRCNSQCTVNCYPRGLLFSPPPPRPPPPQATTTTATATCERYTYTRNPDLNLCIFKDENLNIALEIRALAVSLAPYQVNVQIYLHPNISPRPRFSLQWAPGQKPIL